MIDPIEAHEIWQAKVQAAHDAFERGEFPMTLPVYAATLYALGFRGQNLQAEINLHRRDR